MAQTLVFSLATNSSFLAPRSKPSAPLGKQWLPPLDVMKATKTTQVPAARSKRRAAAVPAVCSLGGDSVARTLTKEHFVPRTIFHAKSSFPEDFTFGTASSAYQVEGAWNEGGRGPSIWDTFTHEQPHKIKGGANGDVACDSYNRYEEDVELMKALGVDSYRFSISWSRIMPDGTKKSINKEGIQYYNKLINKLLDNGITPYVTLFHWDVPQALHDKYGGFLCKEKEIVNDFVEYAKVCFKEFGDRVKHWITLNEPWSFSIMGHCLGSHSPGRCSPIMGCPAGDSLVEPYIVAHNQLLAHAKAVDFYRNHFQRLQKGVIGATLNSMWFEPYTDSPKDKDAVNRCIEFQFGWFMDPLYTGDYPFSMRALVRERLPKFTDEEQKMLRGSYDFIGLNYYSSRYVSAITEEEKAPHALDDSYVNFNLVEKNGSPIGQQHGDWIYMVPDGIRDLLLYIKERYNDPKIYITENGTLEVDDLEAPIEEPTNDPHRVDYLISHLAEIRQAIRKGANVKGYFLWSIMDNFEWHEGYTHRFGLHYVDPMTKERIPKNSAKHYSEFLKH